MSRWYIKPNGSASADREALYSSNEFIDVIKKAGEIMGTKREDGRCFDGGTCGLGGFCDHCPLINNDETENFEALSCANESIRNLKDQLAAIKEENERLKARVAELENAVYAVEDLIQNSDGVAGLHMNGDIAEWSSLLAGGTFEEWLIDYSAAASSLTSGAIQ